MKGTIMVEAMRPFGLTFYAGICGWTLARAEACAPANGTLCIVV